MDGLPKPPVPANVDLRKKDYMPLHGDICFASTAWLTSPPEARVAMLQLWWHAWSKQVPAGSLPNDEATLRAVAGFALAPERWAELRGKIMAKWYVCSDGRLYHPFLAERVQDLLKSRHYTAERVRKHRQQKPAQKSASGNANVTLLQPPPVTRTIRYDTIRDDKQELDQPSAGWVPEAVTRYNAEASRHGWPIAKSVTGQRLSKLKARLAQHGIDGWAAAMDRAGLSGFLARGEGARPGWVPDLDFFVQDQSFNRLIEGKYDDRQRADSGAQGEAGGVTGTALRGILASGRKAI